MKRRSHAGAPSVATGLLLALTLPAAVIRGAPATVEDRLGRATLRCVEQSDLIACDDALNLRPNSPELLTAEADALLRLKRPGEAIGVYRNALTVGAKRAGVERRIASARALRRLLLQTCFAKPVPVALNACEAAWLPGAADEVAVFKRRADLLQAGGAYSAALDAYMAAARLNPRDRPVARSIIALAARTGRKDPATLVALAAARQRLYAERAPAAPRPSTATTDAVAAAADAVEPVESFSNQAEATRSN